MTGVQTCALPIYWDLMKQWGWKGIQHIGALGALTVNPNIAMVPGIINTAIDKGNEPVNGLTKEEAKEVGVTQPFETLDDFAWNYGFKPFMKAGVYTFENDTYNNQMHHGRYMGPSESDKVFTSLLNPIYWVAPELKIGRAHV